MALSIALIIIKCYINSYMNLICFAFEKPAMHQPTYYLLLPIASTHVLIHLRGARMPPRWFEQEFRQC